MDSNRGAVDGVERALKRDVAATLGARHVPAVDEILSKRWTSARGSAYTQWLVDEVQQFFHDTFVDTAWPACPRHPNHPLWLNDGWWMCERDTMPVARLGELSGPEGA